VANRNFHVHLVSDSTGETVSSVARACLVQYEGIFVQEHVWSLVRTKGQMDKVMQAVERDRGPVLYTLVDQELRDLVRDHCRRLQLPCVGVLDQAMSVLAVHFHSKSEQWPGRQHRPASISPIAACARPMSRWCRRSRRRSSSKRPSGR
jgi:regulator of PEP synthase PpsR (kinase-PPPase family)